MACRFCDAMIQIKSEADDIISGKQPRENNILKNAPHTMSTLTSEEWNRYVSMNWLDLQSVAEYLLRPYSRQSAAYPLPWLREKKFWPSVSRIDDAFGDLNLIVSISLRHCIHRVLKHIHQCDCPSVEETENA